MTQRAEFERQTLDAHVGQVNIYAMAVAAQCCYAKYRIDTCERTSHGSARMVVNIIVIQAGIKQADICELIAAG